MAQESKIRLLIVDDIPETVENLKKLLYFESDIEVVGTASNGRDAVSLSKQLQPDVVLMDINLPDLDGIQAAEEINADFPHIQTIMMSVQSEADYLRRSMLAGAREFLTKPFSSDELVTAIRRVYSLRPKTPAIITTAPPTTGIALPPLPTRLGQVLVVYSPKGGAGGSTLAINLALALKEETDEQVVLIDANLQFGDLSVLLNLRPDRTIADLASQSGELDRESLEAVLQNHASGLRVLLAPPRPEMADLLSAEQVRKIVTMLQQSFGYVVVDTLSLLHDVTLNLIDLATQVLLVITPDIPTIKNAKLFFDVMEALGHGTQKVLLILNRSNLKSSVREEDIVSSIKHPIFARLPNDELAVVASANNGAPLYTSQRGHPFSRAIMVLAQRLKQELAPKEAKPAAMAKAAIQPPRR